MKPVLPIIMSTVLAGCSSISLEQPVAPAPKPVAASAIPEGPVTLRTKRVFLGVTPLNASNVKAAPAAAIKVIAVKAGDSLRTALETLAEKNGFAVDWNGPDLFFKQDARFEGESFQETANKILIASRLIGYINKDDGKVLHVFVQ